MSFITPCRPSFGLFQCPNSIGSGTKLTSARASRDRRGSVVPGGVLTSPTAVGTIDIAAVRRGLDRQIIRDRLTGSRPEGNNCRSARRTNNDRSHGYRTAPKTFRIRKFVLVKTTVPEPIRASQLGRWCSYVPCRSVRSAYAVGAERKRVTSTPPSPKAKTGLLRGRKTSPGISQARVRTSLLDVLSSRVNALAHSRAVCAPLEARRRLSFESSTFQRSAIAA